MYVNLWRIFSCSSPKETLLFSSTVSVLRTLLTHYVRVFHTKRFSNSQLILRGDVNFLESAQTPQGKAQPHGTVHRPWVPLSSPGSSPVLLNNWPQIRGSSDPFLSFHNLLRQLTELRKVLYLLFPIHCKGYNSLQVKRRNAQGKVCGKGRGAAALSLGMPPAWHLGPQPGSPPNPMV